MLNLKKEVGAKIAKLRKTKGWTQEKFAEIIDINISSLSNIETGNSFPQPSTFEKIIAKLEIKPQDLFTFDEIKSNNEIYEDLIKKIKFIKKDSEKLHIAYAFIKNLI